MSTCPTCGQSTQEYLIDSERMGKILAHTSDVFDVPADLIRGKRRQRLICDARHAFCLSAYRDGHTLRSIAIFMGRPKHMHHNVHTAAALEETDPGYRDRLAEISRRISHE